MREYRKSLLEYSSDGRWRVRRPRRSERDRRVNGRTYRIRTGDTSVRAVRCRLLTNVTSLVNREHFPGVRIAEEPRASRSGTGLQRERCEGWDEEERRMCGERGGERVGKGNESEVSSFNEVPAETHSGISLDLRFTARKTSGT